jgi:hypothetical protein
MLKVLAVVIADITRPDMLNLVFEGHCSEAFLRYNTASPLKLYNSLNYPK